MVGCLSTGEPFSALNESPSEKEGKSTFTACKAWYNRPLNESPSEKEGKYLSLQNPPPFAKPSMKVPPKRKGNLYQEAG